MPTEKEILKVIRKITPNSKKYLFDDAAIVEKNLILTTDTIVENIHFNLKNYSPFEIGWKAIAVNLSDIASMGGKPLYALASLSLPKKLNINCIRELYKGIYFCAKKYHTQIIGGNITSAKELSISITLIGKANNPAKRKNAKNGDYVFVTGNFGSAACGYLLLKNKKSYPPSFFKSIKTPTPKITLGQKIVSSSKRVSMMDSSDGLADCLIQISELSKVKIIIDENKIPILKNLKFHCKELKVNPINLALYGGEDYELVGTISKKDYLKIKKIKDIKIIGEVFKGNNAYIKSGSKTIKLDKKKCFNHFK